MRRFMFGLAGTMFLICIGIGWVRSLSSPSPANSKEYRHVISLQDTSEHTGSMHRRCSNMSVFTSLQNDTSNCPGAIWLSLMQIVRPRTQQALR